MRKHSLVWFLLLVWMPVLAFAQEDESKKKEAEKPSAKAQIRAIKSQHRKSSLELARVFREAETDEDRDAVRQQRQDVQLKLTAEMVAITRACDDERLAVRSLAWLNQYNKGKARDAAADELLAKYIGSKHLDDWVKAISRSKTPAVNTEKWLRRIMADNPDEEIQGVAALRLLEFYQQLGDTDEQMRDRLVTVMGDGAEAYLKKWTPEACTDEIDKLAKMCVDKYSDVSLGRSTVGGEAERIMAKANLKVGRVAPDIIGEDLDGVSFKLSDYRGKVVLLDFWGDW